MAHDILIQLAGILVLGILAQWIAWRIRLPSILLLLATGLLAGPVSGWLVPDELFGNLMLPAVSLSVAVILYEGGLNLKLRELRSIEAVFLRLTTIGVLLSWGIGTVAGYALLDLEWSVATLLGAILVVTGPTVIGPILRQLRLRGKAGSLLKWEGIIIDPVGATLAVLVFTVIQAGADPAGFAAAATSLGLTIVIGLVVGALAAGMLVLAMSRFWVPDSLCNPVSLMLVFIAFTISNMLQHESGLLSVTVMGIVLANQSRISVRRLVEFKENLAVLLISSLFIVLAASLRLEDLRGLDWRSLVFVGVLLFVARPVSVLVATWRSSLTWQERCFLACMAPRGIVAAAISSVFAFSLVSAGYPHAVEIIPITFLVVFATVLIYGLIAVPLARRLGLSESNPQGLLLIGAEAWVRSIARAISEENYPVFLVDTDWENVRLARMEGLPCLYGNALVEHTREEIDYSGLGRMLALTPNNAVNSLACLLYSEDFGRREVYQLPFALPKEGARGETPSEHRGRFLFGKGLDFARLTDLLQQKYQVKKTKLTKEFDYAAFLTEYGEAAHPLFVLHSDQTIRIFTEREPPEPKPGDILVSLAGPLSDLTASAGTPPLTPPPAA